MTVLETRSVGGLDDIDRRWTGVTFYQGDKHRRPAGWPHTIRVRASNPFDDAGYMYLHMSCSLVT